MFLPCRVFPDQQQQGLLQSLSSFAVFIPHPTAFLLRQQADSKSWKLGAAPDSPPPEQMWNKKDNPGNTLSSRHASSAFCNPAHVLTTTMSLCFRRDRNRTHRALASCTLQEINNKKKVPGKKERRRRRKADVQRTAVFICSWICRSADWSKASTAQGKMRILILGKFWCKAEHKSGPVSFT